MALFDATVRHARTTGKAYTLGDIDGLSLVVSPQGGKSWHFRYCWAGRQKRMSLGIYPEVGLHEARDLRDEARALLAKDINLHSERKRKRHTIVLASEHTFMAVYKQWLTHRRLTLEEGRQTSLEQIPRMFENDVFPVLRHLGPVIN